MNAKDMAERLKGTDAAAILVGAPYRSFCQGSDTLVELGLWDNDGQMSDFAKEVRDALRAG